MAGTAVAAGTMAATVAGTAVAAGTMAATVAGTAVAAGTMAVTVPGMTVAAGTMAATVPGMTVAAGTMAAIDAAAADDSGSGSCCSWQWQHVAENKILQELFRSMLRDERARDHRMSD